MVSGRAHRGGRRRARPHQVVPSSSTFHLSAYGITLIGKYMCYGMLALAVDLIWGYCGILSLGHAAFFSLGGLRNGYVFDATDRPERRVRRSRVARFHGVSELEISGPGSGTASTTSRSP